MLYKKILVPFDGSEPAKSALVVAKKLVADDADAVLHVITIIPSSEIVAALDAPVNPAAGSPLMFADTGVYEQVIDDARKNAERDLNECLGDMLADVSYKVNLDVVISSRAADGIVEFAEENGIEIIVMGRRGLGALRGMLGSVSYAVLHKADVPVLTVK